MPDTTADISNLAAAEKVSLTHARQIARDFEQWAQTMPGAPVGRAGVRRGFGLGTLLKLGAIAIQMFRRLTTLAAGGVVIQSFTLLGQQRWIAIGSGTPPTIPGAQ